MEGNQDKVSHAHALLSSLRRSIDQPDISEYNSIKSSYVEEYHNALDLLEKTGINVAQFRIPDSELRPQLLSASRDGNRYSEEKYVRKSYFLNRLDAIIMTCSP